MADGYDFYFSDLDLAFYINSIESDVNLLKPIKDFN